MTPPRGANDHGLANPGLIIPNRLLASEGVVLPGDQVAVVGFGASQITPTGESSGYRSPPREYVVEASEDTPLTLVWLGRARR